MTKDNPYTTVTVSGYNASPPPDDGTNVDANKVEWAKVKEKIGDPINTAVAAVNTSAQTGIGASKCQGRVTQDVQIGSIKPTIVGGAASITTATTVVDAFDLTHLAFGAATREHAQFSFKVPKSWDQGAVNFQIEWSATHATATESVVWGMSGVAMGDGVAASTTGTATEVVVADAAQSTANGIYFTSESANLTLTNATATDIQRLFFDVWRDATATFSTSTATLATATGDTFTDDARLVGVVIYLNEDKREDS